MEINAKKEVELYMKLLPYPVQGTNAIYFTICPLVLRMTRESFEQKIASAYKLDRQKKQHQVPARVIGIILIVCGLGYLGHWYFDIGGRLLLFPKSTTVYQIAELGKAGNCRFRARIERAFSLLAIAFERESYLAEDGTGKIKVDFPHTVTFPEKEVWIVGIVNAHGNSVKAIWIGDKFSWDIALEIIVPIVLNFFGIFLLYISFRASRKTTLATCSSHKAAIEKDTFSHTIH